MVHMMMDERARQILDNARDTVERVEEEAACREVERQAETLEERLKREAQEDAADPSYGRRGYLPKWKREHFEQREQQRDAKPKPKPQPGMTAADRAWVQQRLEELTRIIADETGKADTKIIKALREEIAGLRAEIEILRQHKVSSEGSVTSLRNRHVA